jgi:protocatechuate 3,4-dioxygenase alpha subunit
MSSKTGRIPSGSQTVGPYFRIGLEYLVERMGEVDGNAVDLIEIRGRLLDRDGASVPDGMLEFWSTGDPSGSACTTEKSGIPVGFRRVATDAAGCFAARIGRPVANCLEDGTAQAPHALVLVFARGLMRHLMTRVYLADEDANQDDPVLLSIPDERRATLMAKPDEKNVYLWDIHLQGGDETVFFAW